ncbi:MAG TPA: hypothetical protein VMU34_23220 [Mycobacterium sp.]|nr:hypothetical protein [Mycobacterium sp.]
MPWASVFDPAANARALSAIQAEGFRAASRLVDRFVRLGRTSRSLSPPGDQEQISDLERLTRAWWSMAGQFLLGSARSAGPTVPSPALDLGNGEVHASLEAAATAPGDTSVEIWLHNRGTTDRGVVRLHCSDLLAHDGSVIPSSALSFDHAAVPMPGRTSRGIELRIKVPDDAPAGRYRGVVLAHGHPQLWLSLVLTVQSSAS